jgi:5-formyltetrahydrofolate cyclo-ligase
LGYGGGYYDRFFTSHFTEAGTPPPFRVAFCFAFQLVPALPFDPWDQPVDAICTEHGLVPATRNIPQGAT